MTMNILCETNFITSEFLLQDYLEQINFPNDEYYKFKLFRLCYMKSYMYGFLFRKMCIDIFLENNELNIELINKKISEMDDYDKLKQIFIKIKDESVKEIIQNGYEFRLFQRYILGTLLASDLHQRIKDNPKSIQYFKFLNDNMYNLSLHELLLKIGENFFTEKKDEIVINYEIIERIKKNFTSEITDALYHQSNLNETNNIKK